MSLSRSCEGCPFNVGFKTESEHILQVCSDPSQSCINARNKLIGQVAAWNRMAIAAESNRTGKLKFSQLTTGDYIHITSIHPAQASHKPDRELRIMITEIRERELAGLVSIDTYAESEDLDAQFYALPRNSEVVLYGAYEKTGEEDDMWDGIPIPGELHVGRYIRYGQPDQNPTIGLYVHEITLISDDQSLCMTMFDASPNESRPAPPIYP